MSYSALRSSPKRYASRPAAKFQAARGAWDVLAQNPSRLVSLGLLDGLWIGVYEDGSMDDVEAGWITALTPSSLAQLAAALDHRFSQGRL